MYIGDIIWYPNISILCMHLIYNIRYGIFLTYMFVIPAFRALLEANSIEISMVLLYVVSSCHAMVFWSTIFHHHSSNFNATSILDYLCLRLSLYNDSLYITIMIVLYIWWTLDVAMLFYPSILGMHWTTDICEICHHAIYDLLLVSNSQSLHWSQFLNNQLMPAIILTISNFKSTMIPSYQDFSLPKPKIIVILVMFSIMSTFHIANAASLIIYCFDAILTLYFLLWILPPTLS